MHMDDDNKNTLAPLINEIIKLQNVVREMKSEIKSLKTEIDSIKTEADRVVKENHRQNTRFAKEQKTFKSKLSSIGLSVRQLMAKSIK